jgi:hypothetical protein
MLLLVQPLRADAPPNAPSANIDLALCLDVSSSMNGLIDSAKSRLWDIVNELAKAEPTPNLRVALYSYGHTTYDPKTGWVRKELDFTSDLDEVNGKLFGLRTSGGTELVARVCNAALEQLAWSKDPKALKIIFVCGNEGAAQDKEIALKTVADKALGRGVIVNTIFCGPEAGPVAQGWRDFALMAEGRFAAINQSKATVAIATPQDKQLAELGAKLSETYVFAGRARAALEANQRLQDLNAEKQGSDVAAARAVAKANGIYRFQEDLVERVQKNEKLELDKIAGEDLPESLRKLSPAEREQRLKDLAAQRTAIQKQILELNRAREQFLREAAARPAAPGQAGFDDAVRGSIRDQAKAKGIKLKQ